MKEVDSLNYVFQSTLLHEERRLLMISLATQSKISIHAPT